MLTFELDLKIGSHEDENIPPVFSHNIQLIGFLTFNIIQIYMCKTVESVPLTPQIYF